MFVVSTSKKTVLSDFATLEAKAVHEHSNGEATDFQFFSKHGVFVEINVKSGLEVMRIKEKHQKLHLQRVRKLNVDTLSAVACAKQSMEEIAVGMANGSVNLYNINSAEIIHRFTGGSSRNAALHIDYNVTDEYLASIHENGAINIFGMKTKAKIETINIDGYSILGRFHPNKRFLLAVASHTGAVTIYDSQAKKKVFHAPHSHKSPCRDLCFSKANNNTLVSVGYDCVVNIYDTRRRTVPLEITCRHPLSAVDMSECGRYICVGNLKGELATLDIRNLKETMVVKTLHDTGVCRLGFVPDFGDQDKSNFSANFSNNSATENSRSEKVAGGSVGNSDLRKSIAKLHSLECTSTPSQSTRLVRDSMCDFLEIPIGKASDRISLIPGHRDSYDWDTLGRRASGGEARNSVYQPWCPLNGNASNNSTIPSSLDSFDAKLNQNEVISVDTREPSPASVIETSTASIISDEQPSQNETKDVENSVKTTTDDKENRKEEKKAKRKHRSNPRLESTNNATTPLADSSNSTTKNTNPNENANINASIAEAIQTEVAKQINDLRGEMKQGFKEVLDRIRATENEVNYVADNNKWEIISQNSHLAIKHSNSFCELRECLSLLMQTDPYVTEYARLKAENEALKKQIVALNKK